MNLKYRYLFPYEKVPVHSKVLIYGAGELGQEYYAQLVITNYCRVVGFVDRNHDRYINPAVPVYGAESIRSLDFDYVVVALRTEIAYNEIARILLDADVAEDKIVAVFERECKDISLFAAEKSAQMEERIFAYRQSRQSIAVLTTGGIGDSVIQKRLMTEIVRLLPDCCIDIYNIKTVDFIKELYSDVPNVKNVIDDLGFRYAGQKGKYSLALTVEACYFIHVDYFEEAYWQKKAPLFAERISHLMKLSSDDPKEPATRFYAARKRRMLNGYNAYTGMGYGGAFEIPDKNVNIPLNRKVEPLFEAKKGSWNNSSYLTINSGNGDCAEGSKVAKSWPVGYYNTLVAAIKESYPDMDVVQLGDREAARIEGCDEYLLGEDISLIEYVLKYASLHIDIEGGLVHIASQLGTKCVVLFGPTDVEFYGYHDNVNICVGKCRGCWGLYGDVNKCARGMKEPECMYSITPEIVLGYVKKELENHE